MTLDPSIVPTGFLTSATPDGFSDTIQVLAAGRIPGVLEPGERMEVPVYLVGFSGNDPLPRAHSSLSWMSFGPTAATSIVDWVSSKESLRPAGIDPQAWDAIFENYEARVGTFASDYVRLLDSNAAYLSRIGEDVTDVAQLNGFTVAQADGLHPIQTLGTTTDANVPAPGLDLELTRSISRTRSPPLPPRRARPRLVPLVGDEPGGRAGRHGRRVHPRRRSSARSSRTAARSGRPATSPRPAITARSHAWPTDRSTCARRTDCSTHYGSDGKLAFVEDLNGNRITATYTGDLLTRLEHSSGQFLALAYNAAGLLETVTDSDGRVVRYTYDEANEHLVQFEDFDGRITHYTYTDGTDIQQKHALATIEAPSGVTRHFAYDDQGRLRQHIPQRWRRTNRLRVRTGRRSDRDRSRPARRPRSSWISLETSPEWMTRWATRSAARSRTTSI